MGKPKAPDPKETAAAQTGTNIGTAITSNMMNSVDQVTPDGSLTYETTGYETYTDPYTGQSYQIPKRKATQTLSDVQQGIYDTGNVTKQNLANIGAEQSEKVQGLLNTPFSLDNEAVESRLYDLGSKRLDPRFATEDANLRTVLANKGIREGSAAWNAEMGRATEGKNDAYNQLLLQGRGQAVQEALTERNQPLNEIIGLLSGAQVQQPNFINAPQSQVANTDVAGLIGDNYKAQMSSYNDLMGGIMGMGSKLIGLSDKRAKKDTKKVGKANGMGLYEFRYKGEPGSQPKHVGLMAQDVEKKMPSAVHTGRDGLKRVDYGRALGLMGV